MKSTAPWRLPLLALSVVALAAAPASASADEGPPAAAAKAGKEGKKKGKKGGKSGVPAPTASGMLQVFGTLWDQDVDPVTDPASYGDPEDDPGFKIRRARIGLGADENGVRYDITVGYSSGYDAVAPSDSDSIQIISAEAGYRLTQGLWLQGGIQKVPVSRTFLMSASQLALGDRAVASNWSIPARDVGATLDGTLGSKKDGGFKGRMRVGAYNGNVTQNSTLRGDDNPGVLVAVRAEGMYGPGNTYRTWGEVDGFTIGFAGDFWSDKALSTSTMGYGGDVIIRVAGLAAVAEAHWHTIKPANSDLVGPGVLADTPRMGLTGQLGYSVWMLEPVVRYSMLDDHTEFEDNGDVAITEGGITWHSDADVVRAGLLYAHRAERGGTTLDNDTARVWMQLAF